jgi:23S rRNA (uridine2552-2'-O)-methyltransferase
MCEPSLATSPTQPQLKQSCHFCPQTNVVLCDAAPNISGVWEVDHARQIDLATKSLEIAIKLLQEGGNYL